MTGQQVGAIILALAVALAGTLMWLAARQQRKWRRRRELELAMTRLTEATRLAAVSIGMQMIPAFAAFARAATATTEFVPETESVAAFVRETGKQP